MIFYPFYFTYVCPTELIAYSESMDKFRENNTEIIGISTDSHFTHLAWVKLQEPREELENLISLCLLILAKKFPNIG